MIPVYTRRKSSWNYWCQPATSWTWDIGTYITEDLQMKLVYIIMERLPEDRCKSPVKVCYLRDTANSLINEMREVYPENSYSLYQCPYEE